MISFFIGLAESAVAFSGYVSTHRDELRAGIKRLRQALRKSAELLSNAVDATLADLKMNYRVGFVA